MIVHEDLSATRFMTWGRTMRNGAPVPCGRPLDARKYVDPPMNAHRRLPRLFFLDPVVFERGTTPELHIIRDPIRLGWHPVVQVAHYHVGPDAALHAAI